ncbi:hypothetical protein L1987_39950 [Smallanthus sonchifolius]|uniref:Uncharacterized protein n=1 Tax=Smallanthus sonchifolius TaxID=185202 RepID=A0ACB9GUG6_9ASTR|nr:hypothetical protein L1987_39950 [Smallanthus sonchifolius]
MTRGNNYLNFFNGNTTLLFNTKQPSLNLHLSKFSEQIQGCKMANKFAVMASSFTGEAFESIDVDVSDSDSWQVVDPSYSDDGNFSYGGVTTTTDDDDEEEEVESDVDDLLQHPYGSMQSLVDQITHHCQELNYAYEIDHIHQKVDIDAVVKIDHPYEEEGDESEEEDEDDDDDDDSDLDDELVPKWLNNRFERQRMRKLGKKVYPKMKKSKRLANQYNKPGCVHGKHGLGMKHNVIW